MFQCQKKLTARQRELIEEFASTDKFSGTVNTSREDSKINGQEGEARKGGFLKRLKDAIWSSEENSEKQQTGRF